jgi:hypothetical protein
MKHASSKELFAYWDMCRGHRLVPDRADIEPGEIRHALADIFILTCDPAQGYPFRLAGTRMCALFGRELKAERFLGLWRRDRNHELPTLLATIADEAVGAVASVDGQTDDGRELLLELLLLPLRHRDHSVARIIGALAPMSMPYWFGVLPVGDLSLRGLRHLGENVDIISPPLFTAAPAEPAARARFVVHQGGRMD